MDDYSIPTFPIKRLRYFNNQFLNQQDFIDDQAVHLAHERAQLRALCVAGVYEGFALTFPTAAAASVGQGVAVDRDGQMIVLKDPAAGPAPSGLAAGTYLLHIRFNEVAADQAIGQGASDFKHWLSQPLIGATLTTAALPAGAVVLGSFTVASDHTVSAGSLAGRQHSGLRLPGPSTTSPPGLATLRCDGVVRGDGSSDGALLTGTLAVRRDLATGIGASLTLTNGIAAPGNTSAGGAIDFNTYDPGPNAPALRIQAIGDGNSSSHLVVLTKAPGAQTNALVERLRVTSAGALQINSGTTMFDDTNKLFTFKDGAGNWARMAAGQLRLFEPLTSETVFVGLTAPAALTASYSCTFPAAPPGGTSLVQMDSSGTLTATNTIASNSHIVLTGTGEIKHGDRVLKFPGCAVIGPNLNYGFEVSAAITLAATSFYLPIVLKQGDRVRSVTLATRGDGVVDLDVNVYRSTQGSGLSSLTPTGNPITITNLTLGYTDTTIDVTDTTLGANDSLFMHFSANASGAIINHIRVTFDRP